MYKKINFLLFLLLHSSVYGMQNFTINSYTDYQSIANYIINDLWNRGFTEPYKKHQTSWRLTTCSKEKYENIKNTVLSKENSYTNTIYKHPEKTGIEIAKLKANFRKDPNNKNHCYKARSLLSSYFPELAYHEKHQKLLENIDKLHKETISNYVKKTLKSFYNETKNIIRTKEKLEEQIKEFNRTSNPKCITPPYK